MYVCTKGDNKLLQCLHSYKDTNLSCRKVLHEAKIITKKTYDYWMQLASALTMNVASLHTVTESCHSYSHDTVLPMHISVTAQTITRI